MWLRNQQSLSLCRTEILWEYLTTFQTPSVFIINQIDHEKADFDNTLEQAIQRFGPKVLPFQFPLVYKNTINIVDTLRMVMYEFPEGGGRPSKRPIPDSAIERAQSWHNALVEAAAENDENLMEKFFEEGSLTEEELAEGLTLAIAHQQIFPVFCASGLNNIGSGRIMGFINDICPSPADRPPAPLENGGTLACDSIDKTTVFIYKLISEPQVGNVSYFKVYSGTLSTGEDLMNMSNQTAERFNHIYISNGKTREQVEKLYILTVRFERLEFFFFAGEGIIHTDHSYLDFIHRILSADYADDADFKISFS